MKKTFAILFFIILYHSPLYGEWRSYSGKQSIANTLENLMEILKKQKIRFRIIKVLSEEKENQKGFILRLAPKGSICKFNFYNQETTHRNKQRSIVRIFTQDKQDSRLFHSIFVNKLKMKEFGIAKIKDTKNDWPVSP